MDSVSSAIKTAANAADACRQIWQLREIWHDAPKEISQLRDELAQANEFFNMVQLAVTKHTWPRTADWVGQLTYELEECFHKAEAATGQLRVGIDTLLHVSLTYGLEISNKRRRALWLRRHDEVGMLRKHLKDAMFEICSILALLDEYVILSQPSNGSYGLTNLALDFHTQRTLCNSPKTQLELKTKLLSPASPLSLPKSTRTLSLVTHFQSTETKEPWCAEVFERLQSRKKTMRSVARADGWSTNVWEQGAPFSQAST